MLQIKEEPVETEVHIRPTSIQHMDSFCRTNQQETSVVTQGGTPDSSGVRQEFIEIELTAVDEQKCAQATSTPIGAGSVNVASGSLNRDVYIKVELEEADLGAGVSVLQHIGSYDGTNQNTSVVGKEDLIVHDDSMLCSRVEKQSVANKSGDTGHTKNEAQLQLYKCDKCPKTFKHYGFLLRHCRIIHGTGLQESSEHLESRVRDVCTEQQYECIICKKMCDSKGELRYHLALCYGVRNAGAEPDVYICDYCRKTFTRKFRIIYHITHAHASGSYKCNLCEESFRCKQYLQKHMGDIHTTLFNKCNICGKYGRLHYFKDHMRYVHSRKKLQCKICGKIMKSKHHLHDHLNDIHGQQPTASPFVNKCDYCRKLYASKKSLLAHINYLHGKDSHRCSECKASFKNKGGLQKHIKMKHSKEKHEDSNQQSTCSKFGDGSRESTHPPEGEVSAVTRASTQQQDVAVIKDEPVDDELELGPVAFQHMDCNYRPYKEEPLLDQHS